MMQERKRFWPQKASTLALLPTSEIWDHVREFRKIPVQRRDKMGRMIDLYSDLDSRVRKNEEYNYGEAILMVSWDRAINSLPDHGMVSKSMIMSLFRIYLAQELVQDVVAHICGGDHG